MLQSLKKYWKKAKNRVQIRKALTRVRLGTYGTCEDCGKMIDTDRLMIYPEATLCVACTAKHGEEEE